MCDYSLTVVATRNAELGETVVTTYFVSGLTRGFASTSDPTLAVCLRPGTEIAFYDDIRLARIFSRQTRQKLARFRKVNIDQRDQHHDALELADGRIVLLNDLSSGQKAVIVQLPADCATRKDQQDEFVPQQSPAEMAGSWWGG
jgi:hypothetical protein